MEFKLNYPPFTPPESETMTREYRLGYNNHVLRQNGYTLICCLTLLYKQGRQLTMPLLGRGRSIRLEMLLCCVLHGMFLEE